MKILTLFFHDYIYSKCNHDSWSNSSMHKVFKNFLKAFNEEKKNDTAESSSAVLLSARSLSSFSPWLKYNRILKRLLGDYCYTGATK